MKRITNLVLLVLFSSVAVFGGGGSSSAEPMRLRLATTTSTENSGLLEYMLPVFEEQNNYQVDVVAVGTGAALQLGRDGNADVVMVHARNLEDQFVADGYGVNRMDLMHNDFVIIGPSEDPAGAMNAQTASEAMMAIAESGSDFVSRGDDSGTHNKELGLWETAGGVPGEAWYREAGQGMGAVLTMSNELGAYTIADRGTWLALKADLPYLTIVFEGDEGLFNPYGVIAVNTEVNPDVNYDGAMMFIQWLVSEEAQTMISEYMVNGEQLFFPDAMPGM